MMQSLLILGRQPALGLAELESRFGADTLTLVGQQAALLDKDPKEVPLQRLGGSIKLAKLLTELPTTNWNQLISLVEKALPEHLGYLPEGKLKFGLSAYDLGVDAGMVSRSTLRIKKVVKSTGRSVRVVPNNEPALNSAQVLYNQLTSPLGMELLLVRNGDRTLLAQTVTEQDIDAYAARDQGRPKRDSKVGMLPPKLAQIIVNLSDITKGTLLDPFCGTGVILQESHLMGLRVYGTDLEQRMIDYTNANLEWLEEKTGSHVQGTTEKADATNHQWKETSFDAIACETYLGRPFSAQPDPKVLQEVMQDVNHIHKKFLQNVAQQTASGFRMCIAVPAWKTPSGFKHLKTLDVLEELGYNRIEFVHARSEDLIYHREGQVVARELVVLQKK